jgi:hypothetical protein
LSALSPLPTCQSVETQVLRLLAQFGVSLLDEHVQDLWVLLEHGMSFRDGFGRVDAAGVAGDAGGPRQLTERWSGARSGVSAGGRDAPGGRAEIGALVERRVDHRDTSFGVVGRSWRRHDAASTPTDTNEFAFLPSQSWTVSGSRRPRR